MTWGLVAAIAQAFNLSTGLAQDAITAWSAGQQVGMTLAAWDERQLAGVSAQTASSKTADARAQALMAAHQLRHNLTSGQSAVRALSPGVTFQITDHSLYGPGADNAFCALSITHEAANNLGHQAAQILQRTDIEQGRYRNQFTCGPGRSSPAGPQTPRLMRLPEAESSPSPLGQSFPWAWGR